MPKDKLNEEFLNALSIAEKKLSEIGFEKDVYHEKGYAQYARFKSKDAKVEFLFGPSDWHIDIIIYISNTKYSFGDLLKIPIIFDWVNSNGYKQENGRSLQNEVFWFIDLLKTTLPALGK